MNGMGSHRHPWMRRLIVHDARRGHAQVRSCHDLLEELEGLADAHLEPPAVEQLVERVAHVGADAPAPISVYWHKPAARHTALDIGVKGADVEPEHLCTAD